MYGHKIHTRIDNLINEMTYPVEVPEYSMRKPDAIVDGEIEPFYVPDRNVMVVSRLSIAQMIDFNYRIIKFRIIDHDDIVEIFSFTRDYASRLAEYTDVPDASNYLIKVNAFIKKLDRSMMLLSRTNAKAKALMAGNLTDIFRSMVVPL